MKPFKPARTAAAWIAFALIFLTCSCKGEKTSDAGTEPADSTGDTLTIDSLNIDSIAAPPRAADGLFDDFIFSYMRSAKFQKSRTKFPLPFITDGKDFPIEADKWHYDPLYSKQDIYTIIFDSPSSIKAEKDTSLCRVDVEWVYLRQHRVKVYHFEKQEGQWMLTSIVNQALAQHENADFYEFYHRFSTDNDFQNSHILNPFHFKTYDSDSFQDIDGLLDVNQWPDFRPELPKGVITNINYGQSYGNKNRRVLMICSQSGGMGCSLTFKRGRTSWMLESLEN